MQSALCTGAPKPVIDFFTPGRASSTWPDYYSARFFPRPSGAPPRASGSLASPKMEGRLFGRCGERAGGRASERQAGVD